MTNLLHGLHEVSIQGCYAPAPSIPLVLSRAHGFTEWHTRKGAPSSRPVASPMTCSTASSLDPSTGMVLRQTDLGRSEPCLSQFRSTSLTAWTAGSLLTILWHICILIGLWTGSPSSFCHHYGFSVLTTHGYRDLLGTKALASETKMTCITNLKAIWKLRWY